MVSAPVVEYLHRDGKLHITACSHLKEESDKLAQRYPGVESAYLNVTENPAHLHGLCEESDVVSRNGITASGLQNQDRLQFRFEEFFLLII